HQDAPSRTRELSRLRREPLSGHHPSLAATVMQPARDRLLHRPGANITGITLDLHRHAPLTPPSDYINPEITRRPSDHCLPPMKRKDFCHTHFELTRRQLTRVDRLLDLGRLLNHPN